MKVNEFRELTESMRRLVNDWYACVSDTERGKWHVRSLRFLAEFQCASCTRASTRDLDNRLNAYHEYLGIVAKWTAAVANRSLSVATPSQAPVPRAARYNKSPGRAVRLARASRSAMRRGYF